ncbi:MAG: glucose 1-dehydrogenase [Rhizobiales bacterium]|nr:glucose 1-dehydrogenase [Hyphomicrobiales bacterium]
MADRLKGRVALVTGGGRGIGRAICDAFAREGASVGVLDIKQEVADKAVAEIRGAGGEATAVVANVGKRAEVFAATEAARAAYGPIDILVNNAMWNRYGPLEDATEESVSRMLDVGFKGVIWATQAVVPDMRGKGCGAIINIGSPSAVLAMANGVMYCGVKAGVLGVTRASAAEFGPSGIRVNAIAPGPTATEGANLVVNEAAWERRRARTPLGRLGTVEDIANAAVFLASDESSFVTGDMMFVDGGITYAFS